MCMHSQITTVAHSVDRKIVFFILTNFHVVGKAGAYRGYMAPGARNKFGAPIFEAKVFRE